MRISVHITSKDRATEICLLLQSFRTQTIQETDFVILDDGYGTPLTSFQFFNNLVSRMKLEGHGFKFLRQDISQGVCAARNKCIEIDDWNNEYILRIDDDVILEPDYIEKLLKVIDAGYDLASGVTPLLGYPTVKRNVDLVKPIINKHWFEGDELKSNDDCGFGYLTEEIISTHQFRSNALYKKEIHDAGIRYPTNLSRVGFREEGFFSIKCLEKGFKLGVNTNAIAYHLQCASGGCRTQTYFQDVQIDDMTFKEFAKKKDVFR